MIIVGLFIWICVMSVLLMLAIPEYVDAYEDEDRRYFARVILGAPFWPVAAVYLIARYVPTLIGRTVSRLMLDATNNSGK